MSGTSCPRLRLICEPWGPGNAAGPTAEQIKAHVWGPYRFRPGTGDAGAIADSTSRTITYDDGLASGDELVFTLERTNPPSWATGTTQTDWERERGSLIRLAFTGHHAGHGTWTLPCEIDTGDGTSQVTVRIPEL